MQDTRIERSVLRALGDAQLADWRRLKLSSRERDRGARPWRGQRNAYRMARRAAAAGVESRLSRVVEGTRINSSAPPAPPRATRRPTPDRDGVDRALRLSGSRAPTATFLPSIRPVLSALFPEYEAYEALSQLLFPLLDD
jgi:hypothetical protein